MPNGECGITGVMLSEATVTLSEAKGLILRLRCFASLSMTTVVLRVTVVAFRVTTITLVSFSIPHSQFIVR